MNQKQLFWETSFLKRIVMRRCVQHREARSIARSRLMPEDPNIWVCVERVVPRRNLRCLSESIRVNGPVRGDLPVSAVSSLALSPVPGVPGVRQLPAVP